MSPRSQVRVLRSEAGSTSCYFERLKTIGFLSRCALIDGTGQLLCGTISGKRSPLARKPSTITWIPVHASGQEGRKVILSGTSRSRLSDKVIARRSLEVKNLQRQPIGKLDSITNDGGALTVVFILNEGAINPGGKFLLGLRRQGLHVSFALSAAGLRPEDESPQAYPGLLGEEL